MSNSSEMQAAEREQGAEGNNPWLVQIPINLIITGCSQRRRPTLPVMTGIDYKWLFLGTRTTISQEKKNYYTINICSVI